MKLNMFRYVLWIYIINMYVVWVYNIDMLFNEYKYRDMFYVFIR